MLEFVLWIFAFAVFSWRSLMKVGSFSYGKYWKVIWVDLSLNEYHIWYDRVTYFVSCLVIVFTVL